MENAAVRDVNGTTITPDAAVSLRFAEGKLIEAGDAQVPDYSGGRAEIKISDVETTGGALNFHIDLTIADDPWVKGASGKYELRCGIKDGKLTGIFTGRFTPSGADASEVRGDVTGMVVPFWPGVAPGVKFAPGEHPRLLLRKADIPILRQRAATPAGQKIIDNLRRLLAQADRGFAWNRCSGRTMWEHRCATPYSEGYYVIGEALMYLLTEKPEHLERAKFRMLDAMTSRDGEAGGWGNAPRMTGVAMGYDLLYDHLDPQFRRTIQGFLRQPRPELTCPIDAGGNPQMMFASAETVCDLALLGDPVPAPKAPQAADTAPLIEPLDEQAIGKGVPIVAFRSGEMPNELLVLGTFPDSGGDPLAGVGGAEKVRPSTDLRIEYGGKTYEPRLLRAASNRLSYSHNYRGHPAIGLDLRLWNDTKKITPQTIYCYTVVDVPAAQAVIAWPDRPDVSVGNRLWINGHAVAQGDVVRLKQGKYGVLLAVPARGLFAVPHLATYDESAARARYERELADWRLEGGTEPGITRRLYKHREYLQRALSAVMGEHGYLFEQYGITDMRSELLLAAGAYESMFGRPLAPDSGLKWSLPLNIHYDRLYWGCDWGGRFWPAYAFANTFDANYWPALRWWIDAELARLDPADYPGFMSQPNHALYLLLNYPWDVEPAPPAEWQLPLVFADSKVGLYLMRSGWDPDKSVSVSVILQKDGSPTSAYAGTSIISNWNRGRLIGHQHLGAGYYASPQPGQAFYETGAQFHIGDLQPQGGANLTHFESKPGGSATLSLKVDRWVQAKKDKEVPTATPVAGLKLERAMGVDYSGASGATALVVYVDRVQGAGDRPVEFRLPIMHDGWAAKPGQAAGRTVQFGAYGKGADPNDRMTVSITHVTPATVKLNTDRKGGKASLTTSGASERFVVVTIQQGEAPKLTITGDGLDAVVEVGEQTVRFDGTKVVFGK